MVNDLDITCRGDCSGGGSSARNNSIDSSTHHQDIAGNCENSHLSENKVIHCRHRQDVLNFTHKQIQSLECIYCAGNTDAHGADLFICTKCIDVVCAQHLAKHGHNHIFFFNITSSVIFCSLCKTYIDSDHEEEKNHFKSLLKNYHGHEEMFNRRSLLNLGNTCFFNSTIQALYTTKQLKDMVRTDSCHLERYGELWRNFLWTLKELWNDEKRATALNPRNLFSYISKRWPIYRAHRQQDSHEFLRLFVDELMEEQKTRCTETESSSMGKQPSNPQIVDGEGKDMRLIFHHVFGGCIKSYLTCQNCKSVSNTKEQFLDLSLPIGNTNKKSVTLETLLDNFLSEDRFSGEKFFECDKCSKTESNRKMYRSAVRTERIWKFPKNLVVHLKRFSQNSKGVFTKSATRVVFPLTLDMAPYGEEIHQKNNTDFIYKLYATIIHIGSNMESGHYVAMTKDKDWLRCDDSHLSSVSEEEVLKTQAYLLFYERVEPHRTISIT